MKKEEWKVRRTGREGAKYVERKEKSDKWKEKKTEGQWRDMMDHWQRDKSNKMYIIIILTVRFTCMHAITKILYFSDNKKTVYGWREMSFLGFSLNERFCESSGWLLHSAESLFNSISVLKISNAASPNPMIFFPISSKVGKVLKQNTRWNHVLMGISCVAWLHKTCTLVWVLLSVLQACITI